VLIPDKMTGKATMVAIDNKMRFIALGEIGALK